VEHGFQVTLLIEHSTLPENSKSVEQLERCTRWFGRLKRVAEGLEEPQSVEHHRDDYFAFFMNCYHLKDWIKKDPSVQHLHDLVERYIDQSPALSICADICNGLKHLTLNSSRSGVSPTVHPGNFWRLQIGLTPGSVPVITGIGFRVVTDAANYDAYDLARDCLKEWELFLATPPSLAQHLLTNRQKEQ
jgi:hypothetical protein